MTLSLNSSQLGPHLIKKARDKLSFSNRKSKFPSVEGRAGWLLWMDNGWLKGNKQVKGGLSK